MEGYRVKKLRQRLSLSRRKLARLAGVSPEAVNLFERNEPLPLNDRRKILSRLWSLR